MRAIWTGAIGFGLVNIPVRLFSATQDSRLDLDMLDKHGHSKIRYVRINEDTGKEVAWENIVKGYKYNDDYVVLSDEDFDKVSPRKSKMVDINEFVSEDKVDAGYFDTPYYLEPAKGGERAYVLLRDALKKTGKVAIGSFILRTRENLCVIRPLNDVLVLVKLRWAEEIRSYDDLDIPKDIPIKAAELKMAESLISQLTSKKFALEKYKDTYDNGLMKIIEAKAKGKKIGTPKFKVVYNKSKDLMSQLKASLEGNKPATKKPATRKKARS